MKNQNVTLKNATILVTGAAGFIGSNLVLELLRTTEDKTYVIAEEVGYTEPNYFSYVFKKKYAMSPSKYRSGG